MRLRHAILCIVVSLAPQMHAGTLPAAVEGVLDLRGIDLDSRPVPLTGSWRCRQLAPEPGEWHPARVPALFSELGLPGEGMVEFALTLQVDPRIDILGFTVPVIHSAHVLSLDGRPVLRRGFPGPTARETMHHWQPGTVISPISNGRVELSLRLANWGYYKGGIPSPLLVGTSGVITARETARNRYEAFLTGSLIMIGLYHLGAFILRRHERAPAFFALFCFLIALRILVTGEHRIHEMFPGISWDLTYRLFMLTQTLGVLAFLGFITAVYGNSILKQPLWWTRRIFEAASAFCLLAPLALLCRSGIALDAATLVVLVVSLIIIVGALQQKRDGSLIMLAGYAVLATTIIHDIIVENTVQHDTLLILPLGLFLFVLSQAWLLAFRFSRAFTLIEDLTKNLEYKVQARTTELEAERNRLRQQGERLQKELEMARTIQMQMIPSASPSPSIAFYYQPMEEVGGDFLDFIPLEDDSLGVIVSDVSGHGVPAALITSMVKSHIQQTGGRAENPGRMLHTLNGQLSQRTGGNFVTAFYGILGKDRREMTYASAGHNHPLIITPRGEVQALDSGIRRLPLAVLHNFELPSGEGYWKSSRVQLAPGSKLLLYTDGLVEAVNLHDAESGDFESMAMSAVLGNLANLPARECVNALVEALRTFRGAATFDDDVCIVCIDI